MRLQHDRAQPVMRVTPEVRGSEVVIDAALPDTQRGRDAATMVRDGTLGGVSVEFRARRQRYTAGVREITSALLTGAGAVASAAGVWGRALATATVRGPESARRSVTPSALFGIGHDLARHGEAVYRIGRGGRRTVSGGGNQSSRSSGRGGARAPSSRARWRPPTRGQLSPRAVKRRRQRPSWLAMSLKSVATTSKSGSGVRSRSTSGPISVGRGT